MSVRTVLRRIAPPPPERAAEWGELRPLSMRANFAWTLAGSGVYGACQWGMLIALAKLGSPEIVGRFALGLALCAPVIMFTNLQLRIVQATDARNEYEFRDYLTLRLLASVVALGVIAGVALISGYRLEVALAVIVIALAKSIESVSDVIYGLLQKSERLDLVALSMIIKGPASLVALALLVAWTGSVAAAAAGMLAVWLAILLTYDAGNARRLAPAPGPEASSARLGRKAAIGRLAWLALPLGVVGLLDSLSVNVPRYLIERSLGEAALGHFAAMAYLIVAGNMVVAALANSAAPRLSRRFVHDLPGFKRLVWKLVWFGIALGVGALLVALLFGRQTLSLLYTQEYAANVDVFVWLMVAAGFGYVARFLVCSMTAARCFRAQTPLYAGSLLVIAALSFTLIPARGLVGAAWALCAGMLALLVGAAVVNVLAVRRRALALESGPASKLPCPAMDP